MVYLLAYMYFVLSLFFLALIKERNIDGKKIYSLDLKGGWEFLVMVYGAIFFGIPLGLIVLFMFLILNLFTPIFILIEFCYYVLKKEK